MSTIVSQCRRRGAPGASGDAALDARYTSVMTPASPTRCHGSSRTGRPVGRASATAARRSRRRARRSGPCATAARPARCRPIVHLHLQPRRALVSEDIRVVRPRGADDLDDARQRGVGSRTHVHRLGAQPDRVDADHRSQSLSHAAQSRAAAAGQTVVPARGSSMRVSPSMAGAVSASGTNVGVGIAACVADGVGAAGAALSIDACASAHGCCSAVATHRRSSLAFSPYDHVLPSSFPTLGKCRLCKA